MPQPPLPGDSQVAMPCMQVWRSLACSIKRRSNPQAVA